MTALSDLLKFDSQTQALRQVSGRLGWDQETMMPENSGDQRGAEMAALEGCFARTSMRCAGWRMVEPNSYRHSRWCDTGAAARDQTVV